MPDREEARGAVVGGDADARDPGEPGAVDAARGPAVGGLIALGLVLLIVGIAITVITKDNATRSGGGTYVVAYGPMIWGAITIFRGLARHGR